MKEEMYYLESVKKYLIIETCELIGIDEPLHGRDVIILEDIVDSGKTMKNLLDILEKHKPSSVKIATLLFKREALIENIKPDYFGFEVGDEFLVGFGLDYCQYGRNLKDLYILKSSI